MKKYILLSALAIMITAVLASFDTNTPENKAELGKLLFSDSLLSADRTISCASCHQPRFAFADTVSVSRGVGGKKGTRNTPTAMNVLLQRFFFWDGRAASLEQQALAPIENPMEMNLPIPEAVARLRSSPVYNLYFRKIFNSEPTAALLAESLAAFERTLETSDSPFDAWKFSGDEDAVSAAVKNGFTIFNTKGKCIKCHFGADFTANEFRNIGLFDGKQWNDSGRALVTGNKEDIGKFKTPSLRNLSVTAPYMHNGRAKTLEDVIEFYNDPGKIVPAAINRDSILAKPLQLTAQEKKDLRLFLLALTDKKFIK